MAFVLQTTPWENLPADAVCNANSFRVIYGSGLLGNTGSVSYIKKNSLDLWNLQEFSPHSWAALVHNVKRHLRHIEKMKMPSSESHQQKTECIPDYEHTARRAGWAWRTSSGIRRRPGTEARSAGPKPGWCGWSTNTSPLCTWEEDKPVSFCLPTDTNTRYCARLTMPGRGKPSSRPSANGKRAASWCSRPRARPGSDAHSPPPRWPADCSCSQPDTHKHETLQKSYMLRTHCSNVSEITSGPWPSVSKGPFLSARHWKSSSLSSPTELPHTNIQQQD